VQATLSGTTLQVCVEIVSEPQLLSSAELTASTRATTGAPASGMVASMQQLLWTGAALLEADTNVANVFHLATECCVNVSQDGG